MTTLSCARRGGIAIVSLEPHPSVKDDPESVVGECTIALVMINDLPADYIANWPPWEAPATDTTSYDNIWHAVDGIWQECLIDDHSLGWTAVGKF